MSATAHDPRTAGAASDQAAETLREQPVVDLMYTTVDRLRAQAERSVASAVSGDITGTPQSLAERDAMVAFHRRRLAELDGVEERLCFGRLDLGSGVRRYVGRIGLPSHGDGDEPLLVDWRAPVAAPFYQATPAARGDVVRRRHLTIEDRQVVAVEDEALDLEALDDAQRSSLVGEGALLAAVGRARTGRMGDIVATMQSEQDRIVRSDLSGALVVQGGPGTGKTAVALHRIAYLMYTHRERLERSGILLVGPSPVFLRYIDRVLPALGETSTVMRTPGTLYASVRTDRHDRDDVARVKGDLRMVRVLRRAVQLRQRVPDSPVALDVDGRRVMLLPADVSRARDRARATRQPHNAARTVFVKSVLDSLVGRLAQVLGMDPDLDPQTRRDLAADLRDSIDVRRAVNLAWLPLTPERVLSRMLSDAAVLDDAGAALTRAERRTLLRSPDDATRWTVEDVALLDELAEIVGEDDTAQRRAQAAADVEQRRLHDQARDALASMGGDAAAMVGADMLAARYGPSGGRATVAEHAARDREWVFGHIVVDEAQELSPMQWRALIRRCPTRSLTLVGDVAQGGAPGAAVSWSDVMDSVAPGRWRLEELHVNYRTPRVIIDEAAALAAAHGLAVPTQQTLRDGDRPVERLEVASVHQVVDAVQRELAALGTGRLAVIARAGSGPFGTETLHAHLVEALGTDAVGSGAHALDRSVAVLDARSSKGLEVDVVVVVDPDGLRSAGGVHGVNDLYVAMTRATQHLIVVTPEASA